LTKWRELADANTFRHVRRLAAFVETREFVGEIAYNMLRHNSTQLRGLNDVPLWIYSYRCV
jgi:hypothetical protein